ncbi:MAG: Nif3-like dinuclear metal center hexameric protein [Clostridia bacterium]|nr:Nif3-like dinuclear metal center hexameric protein [Clostridia bacterium]
MLTVQNVFDYINELAPFDTQDAWDNSGLLLGDPAAEVRGIHVALDCTEAVCAEAERLGANLIVTHHPVIFSGLKNIRESAPGSRLLCRLIRSGIAVICAHTNIDAAQGGTNDTLAQLIGLTNIRGEGCMRVGDLPETLTAVEVERLLTGKLHTVVRRMGPADALVRVIGMCTGGGSEFWQSCHAAGAEAFISGEIRHHHALEAASMGMVCFECGHHATEEPGIFALADALQNASDALQWKVTVTKSQADAYTFCP